MPSLPIRRAGSLLLGLGLGLAAIWAGYRPTYMTRLMITSIRQPLWRHPAELGLPAEDVVFPASDGTTLHGWFIPRSGDNGRPAPAIVFVHGWPWNRLGNRAGSTLIHDRTVDFLEPAQALHQAGFHVLLFDLRNHGMSAAAIPVTFGVNEARDFVGAVQMLRQRPDVDGTRIGAIGYSMGANTLLYGIPQCQPIRAAIAIQPVRPATFAPHFARSELGPLGPLLLRLAGPIHQAFGAPPLHTIDPVEAARGLGPTMVQYVQGSGDPWGTLADVQAMVTATPHALPLIVAPSSERYEGYLYLNNHPEEVIAFFRQYVG